MLIYKVPYERGGGAKSAGAKYGPDAIEAQFRKWPWRVGESGGADFSAEFLSLNEKGGDESLFRSFAAAAGMLLAGGVPAFAVLSGDNSCAFHTVTCVAERFPKPNLVVLDAHPDACGPDHDPHATWVRRLWEMDIVQPRKTLFLGIRDAEPAEAAYISESDAKIFTASALSGTDSGDLVRFLLRMKAIDVSAALVCVVDIDALDPAFAPGTGVLRSGGLDVRQVLSCIRALGRLPFPATVGEISEVIPAEGDCRRPLDDRRPDPAGLTVLAAEAILREMICSFA